MRRNFVISVGAFTTTTARKQQLPVRGVSDLPTTRTAVRVATLCSELVAQPADRPLHGGGLHSNHLLGQRRDCATKSHSHLPVIVRRIT